MVEAVEEAPAADVWIRRDHFAGSYQLHRRKREREGVGKKIKKGHYAAVAEPERLL